MSNLTVDKTLRVIVHLRNKNTKEFSENVDKSSGDNIDMKSLSQNLVSLQTKVNNFLTELVEQEREKTKQSNGNAENNDNQQLEDDDEDDDDDDEDINEPPMKQQKT